MFLSLRSCFGPEVFPGALRRTTIVFAGMLALQLSAEQTEDLVSEAFSAPSIATAPTMFATLEPERTGITAVNAYDDPRMWWALYREFSLGAIGTGVAIDDYDSDGRPDVFVVNKTGTNHLYRNLGDFRFEDVSEFTGVAGPLGAWKQGAAFADIDNDGRPDLYVCRFGAPNLLYVNQGDGTFREEAAARGLALADASSMAAFSDYDRDGWLDVYVQTNLLDGERRPNGQRDRLFRNQRNGMFIEVTDAAGIRGETQGHSATWWDYNEDGWPDLYVANDFKDPDQLYRNNGDGTFTNVLSYVVPHTPHSAMGSDLGDVNNDGHLDLLVADMAASKREADQRGMARLRVGLTDNVQRPEAAPQYMRNALFLNTGAGVMLEGAFLAGLDATDWTWSVRLEDLDNDGRLDAYFTNGMVRELHNADVVARMSAKESMTERIRIMRASPPLAERNLVYRNGGDLTFVEKSAAWGLDHLGIALGAALGDLDGDGDLDLVFASMDGSPTVCRNDQAGGHAVTFALRGTKSNRFGLGATVRIQTEHGRQVRTLTSARGYLSTSQPVAHFGLGNERRVKRVTIDWPSGHSQVLTDLPAGRRYTVSEPQGEPALRPAMQTTGNRRTQFQEKSEMAQLRPPKRERPWQEPAVQVLLPFRLDRAGPPDVFARLDKDAEDDLVIGGAAGEPGQLYSNLGGGQFLGYGSNGLSQGEGVSDGPIVALDADADNDLDLLVTKSGVPEAAGAIGHQPRLLINDGSGRFSADASQLLPPLAVSTGAAVAADFTRSGHLSVFIGARLVPGHYPQSPRSALLTWRDGKYVDVIDEFAPALAQRGMVTAALWSDVDGDGWLDLLVAYDWGSVACLRNDEGKALKDVSEAWGFARAGTGWWRSLAAADFNGDGRMDYAVGNIGLNTRYRASLVAPALLFDGVTIEGSAPQLIEAELANGELYPLRSRETLARSFPSVARRFPSTDAFARATLDEVVTPGALGRATRYAATEFQSAVFLSQADGTFAFKPLPRLAQLAPIYGLAAGDFDGDGAADILAVGNSFAPIPEVSRFDGAVGWLLKGDRRGGFEAVSPADSGFIARRDARALAVADLNQDGWPDAVVTRHNDQSLVFMNQPAASDRHSFAVSLSGEAGNPAAIGARLTLTLADNSTQTTELAAGSGYFSQSSATAFFGYRDGATPRDLRIRWPDGRESGQTFDAAPPKTMRVSAP